MIPIQKKDICRRCPYYGQPFVAGHGNENAHLVLVGDSPWKSEAESGLPFQGPAGQILDICLEETSINRNDIFITNLIHCKPFELGENHPDGVIELCMEHFLKPELEFINPDIIVPMGNTALKAFIKDRGNISKQRGIKRTVEWFDRKIDVVPTYHPSFLLRNPAFADYVVSDLQIASGQIKHNARDIKAININTLERFANFWEQTTQSKYIAIDIESTSVDHRDLEIISINIALDSELCYVITFYNPYPTINEETFNTFIIRKIFELIHDKKKVFFLHNGKFDLHGLDYWFQRNIQKSINIDQINWFDTMGMSALLDENMRQGLKDIASLHTSIKYAREEVEDVHGGKVIKMPLHKLVLYGAKDGIATRRIGLKFAKQLEQENLWDGPYVNKDYSDMTIANILFKMENHGAPIDHKKIFEMQHLVESKLKHFEDVMHQEIYSKLGFTQEEFEIADLKKLNVRSANQLRDVLYNVFKFPSTGIKTKKGKKESTDKKALDILFQKNRDSAFLKALKLHRNYDTINKTFIKGFQSRMWDDGRLRPDFSFTKIVSGRIACYNPNLLNIPRDKEFEEGILISMREAFAVPKTHCICMVDISQAEFKVAAIHSQDEKMLHDIFVNLYDFHDMIARAAYPDYTSFEKEAKSVEKQLQKYETQSQQAKLITRLNSLKVALKQWRTTAKNFNFGLLYGGQDDTLSNTLGITIDEVQTLTGRIEDTYPKFWRWIKDFPDWAVEQGVIVNSFKRKRHLHHSFDEWVMLEQGRKGINFIPQSDAAYIVRGALSRIAYECESRGLEAFPFNTVYDSILLDCPIEEREECIIIMAEEMLRPVPELGNRVFSIGIGWGQSWHAAERNEHKLNNLDELDSILASV